MIEQPGGDLQAGVPRRLVVRAVLRAVLTSTVLVVLTGPRLMVHSL